jgi:hypothetical protein
LRWAGGLSWADPAVQGVDLLLDAFARLPVESDWRLVVAGEASRASTAAAAAGGGG